MPGDTAKGGIEIKPKQADWTKMICSRSSPNGMRVPWGGIMKVRNHIQGEVWLGRKALGCAVLARSLREALNQYGNRLNHGRHSPMNRSRIPIWCNGSG